MTPRSREEAPVRYEIVVRGDVSEALADDLGVQCFKPYPDRTLLVLATIDQSHLHGVLERLRDRNIEIERVNPV